MFWICVSRSKCVVDVWMSISSGCVFHAESGGREVVHVCIIWDPEDTVVSLLDIVLFPKLRRPFVWAIRPITIPLAFAPRIPQFQESDFLPVVLEFEHIKYWVAVAINEAIFVFLFIRVLALSYHRGMSLILLLQKLPESIPTFDLIMLYSFWRDSR